MRGLLVGRNPDCLGVLFPEPKCGQSFISASWSISDQLYSSISNKERSNSKFWLEGIVVLCNCYAPPLYWFLKLKSWGEFCGTDWLQFGYVSAPFHKTRSQNWKLKMQIDVVFLPKTSATRPTKPILDLFCGCWDTGVGGSTSWQSCKSTFWNQFSTDSLQISDLGSLYMCLTV